MDIKTKIMDSGIEITEVVSDDAIITIPDEIEGKKVLSIANNAFSGRDNLEELILPDGIKELGPNLLKENYSLYSIKLPKNIERIYTNTLEFDETFISKVLNIDTNSYNKILFDEANKLLNSQYEIYIKHNKSIEAYVPNGDKYICGVCYLSNEELCFKTYGLAQNLTKYSLFPLLVLNRILKVSNASISNSACIFDDSFKAKFSSESSRAIVPIFQKKDINTIKKNTRIDYIDDEIAIVYDKQVDLKYVTSYSIRDNDPICSCGNLDCIHLKSVHYYLSINDFKRISGKSMGDTFVVIPRKNTIKYNYNYLSTLFGEKYFSYISNKQKSTLNLPRYMVGLQWIDNIDLSQFSIDLMNDALKYQCLDNYQEEHYYYGRAGNEGLIYGVQINHDKEKKSRIIFDSKSNNKPPLYYDCFCKSDRTTVCEHCMAVILHFKGPRYFTALKNKKTKIDKVNFQKNNILTEWLSTSIDSKVLEIMASPQSRNRAIKSDKSDFYYDCVKDINSVFKDYDNITIRLIDNNSIEIKNSRDKITITYEPPFLYRIVLENKDGIVEERKSHINLGYIMAIKDKLGPFKDYYYNLFNDIKPLINLRGTLDKRIANLDFTEVTYDNSIMFDDYSYDGIFDNSIGNILLNNDTTVQKKEEASKKTLEALQAKNPTQKEIIEEENLCFGQASTIENVPIETEEILPNEVVEDNLCSEQASTIEDAPIETEEILPNEAVIEEKSWVDEARDVIADMRMEIDKMIAQSKQNLDSEKEPQEFDASSFVIEKNKLKKYIGKQLNVNIPYGITEIGASAFSSKKIKSIIIPNGVDKIGSKAFYNCKELVEVSFLESLLEIGKNAFEKCESLKDIQLPDSVLEIGESAFSECKSLKEIRLPNSLLELGDYAFSGCSSLKNVYIPKNVLVIRHLPFFICENLENIEVDSNNRKYDSREECNALIETKNNRLMQASINTIIPKTVKILGNHAFSYLPFEKIIIPFGVEEIEKNCFGSCDKLKEIIIPSSVKKIEKELFEYIYHEINITIYATKENMNKIPEGFDKNWLGETKAHIKWVLDSETHDKVEYVQSIIEEPVEDVIYEKDDDNFVIGNKLIKKYKGNKKNLLLPDGLESIGANAFLRCKSLVNVKIPEGYKDIRSRAFEECMNLKIVEYPSTMEKVGEGAFDICDSYFIKSIPASLKQILCKYKVHPSIKALTIPKGVEELGKSSLMGEYEEVYLPATVKSIYASSLSSKILKKIVVDSNNKVYDSRENSNAVIETKTNKLIIGSCGTIIPNSVQVIGECAFVNKNIEKINIPDGVKKVEYLGLYHTNTAKEINISKTVTNLDDCLDGEFLERVFVSNDNPVYYSDDDATAIIKKENNRLVYLCKNKPIPKEVKIIGSYSVHCNQECLTIPEGVEELEDESVVCCDTMNFVLPTSLKTIHGMPFEIHFGEKGTITLLANKENMNKIPEGFDDGWINLEYYDLKWKSLDEEKKSKITIIKPEDNIKFTEKNDQNNGSYNSNSNANAENMGYNSYKGGAMPPRKKGCYIATCVYGSYDCKEVWRLRRYRDFYLDNHWFGRAFIKIYYFISPKLVKLFGNQKWFKNISKKLLDKKISKLIDKGYDDTPYKDKY